MHENYITVITSITFITVKSHKPREIIQLMWSLEGKILVC